MLRLVYRTLALFLLAIHVNTAPSHSADPVELMFVDMHRLPADCTEPMSCISEGRPMLSSVLAVTPSEATLLSQVFNAQAVVRGLSGEARASLCYRHIRPIQHDIPPAEKLAGLVNHPGVYFDSTKIDATEGAENFSLRVREVLKTLGLRQLTEEEWQAMPGRPTLSISYTERTESAGCIIPFSVSLSIKEEAILVRDNSIKTSASVYAASAKENLANTNYTQQDALREVLEKFMKDYLEANPL